MAGFIKTIAENAREDADWYIYLTYGNGARAKRREARINYRLWLALSVYQQIRNLLCLHLVCPILGHRYVSEDFANRESGGMGGQCSRCLSSWSEVLY